MDIAHSSYDDLYADPKYHSLVKKVFYSVMAMNPSRGRDFEEALSEVTLHIISKDILSSFDEEKGRFNLYLYRIVRNFFINFSKKAQRTPTDMAFGIEFPIDSSMYHHIESVDVSLELDKVEAYLDEVATKKLRVKKNSPATLSDVLRLARLGYSNREIAMHFGVSMTGVYTWWDAISRHCASLKKSILLPAS